MPLAQLARRARNAKTGTAVLQNAAHYLGEAGAALAAGYWLGRAQAIHAHVGTATAGALSSAVRVRIAAMLGRGTSFGNWVGLWRESAAAVGGHALAALEKPLDDTIPLDQLIAAIECDRDHLGGDGDALTKALERARKRGVIGFFEFLAMFRNKVYGHGTMLPEALCRKLARPFLAAVVHVLRQSCVFEDAWLGRTALDLLSEDKSPYWLRLAGVGERAVSDAAATLSAREVTPGTLYFVTADVAVPLDFWVVQDADATGLSRFGFLQRAVRKRRGDDPFKGLEYLDYLGGRFRHDAHLDQLRERAATWLDSSADEGARDDTGDGTATAADERRFGDFVIETELGRGAMGIVYRANQVSLGRSVALKVLPPALLGDPIALGRFHREVQALGRCDHPNVVRVLASGAFEGRPWFAMELVEGADLSEVFSTLAEWKGRAQELTAHHLSAATSSLSDRRRRQREPTRRSQSPPPDARALNAPIEYHEIPPLTGSSSGVGRDVGLYRRLAILFAEAADGVAEIHNRGVLHRDLKPANLMLSSDGQRLVVMDLGLAKMSDASVSYTRDGGGDFVGSARYAAPEQLQATLLAVDHRADIYSLAATLYELATLHTLYPAVEITELLQEKLTADPRPARAVEQQIPRELETVLQKALARRPEERYSSAREFADDLRAFAEHRPIQARPPSAFDYLRLFYQRQRRLVYLSAICLLLIVGVVSASFLLVTGERSHALQERDVAQRERDNAKLERDRAENLARFIFDDVYHRLEPIGKLELLEHVTERNIDYYKVRDLSDPATLARYAEAIRRLGRVQQRQGKVDIARATYVRAREMLENQRAQGPRNDDVLAVLALTYGDLAGVEFNQNRLTEALTLIERALKIQRPLADMNPNRREWQHALLQSTRQLGVAMERKGDVREALDVFNRAVELAAAALVVDSHDRIALREMAMNRINVGESLSTLGHTGAALTQFGQALEQLDTLFTADPLDTSVRRQKATSHDSIARLLLGQGELDGALVAFELAKGIRIELCQLDPNRAGWQRDLAASHSNVARVHEHLDDSASALSAYNKGLDILQALAKRDPSNIRWQMDIAVTRRNLGSIWQRKRDRERALAHYRQALALNERVVESDPKNTEYGHQLGMSHGFVASALIETGDFKGARVHTSEQYRILNALSSSDPENMNWKSDLVLALHMRGTVHAGLGAHDKALVEFAHALDVQTKLRAAEPWSVEDLRRKQRAAELHRARGLSLAKGGDGEQARRAFKQAMGLFEALQDEDDIRSVRALIARVTPKSPPVTAPARSDLQLTVPSMGTRPIQSRSRKGDVYE